MIDSEVVDFNDPIFLEHKEKFVNNFSALLAGIDSAQSLNSRINNISAIEYEKFGRKISDLAAEYSRGLSDFAEGIGGPAQQKTFAEFSVSVGNAIDNLRAGGSEAYAKYGQAMLDSIRAAQTAKIAGVGGALADLADLSAQLFKARATGDWKGFGETSAQIGTIAVAAEVLVGLIKMFGAAAGAASTPVVVTAFIAVAVATWCLAEKEIGATVFGGISDLVNIFFNQALVWRYYDPLAIDLDGDGIETISVNESTRVLFDLDGDGLRAGTGWLNGDDGWLVLDRNGNGRIDNGGELFGVDTILPNGQKASSGFAALAASDSNYDKVFDAADADFSRAQIWQDFNQNGISDAGELKSLSAAGIASISLASVDGSIQLRGGNFQTASASFTRNDGSTGKVANLNLVTNAFFREFSSKIPATFEASLLPDVRGSGMVRDFREAASLNPELIRDVNSLKGLTRAEALR